MKKMLFSESFYLGAIGDDSAGFPKSWNVQLLVDDMEVPFKLDTGAEVTAISERSYQFISSPCLKKPQKQLRGPNKQPLEVIGTFTTTHNSVIQEQILLNRYLRYSQSSTQPGGFANNYRFTADSFSGCYSK